MLLSVFMPLFEEGHITIHMVGGYVGLSHLECRIDDSKNFALEVSSLVYRWSMSISINIQVSQR